MKKQLITTLLVLGLASPVFAQGEYNMSDQGDKDSGSPVIGTVSEVDANLRTLTVNDVTSGDQKSYSGVKSEDLRGLKPGDKVLIKPDPSDSTEAADVQKQ